MRTILTSALLAIALLAFGQSTEEEPILLTLDDCIKLALDNNIDLKRTKNSMALAQANKTQATMNFLPSANASSNLTKSFGSFFDPNSGKYVSQEVNFSNPNVNLQLSLFNAFYNHHLLHRRDNELDAAVYSVHNSEIQVTAKVLLGYLNVVLDRENLAVSQRRLELLNSQLEREEKRESVGVGNMETVYNFRSQVATEKLTLINQQNKLKIDMLSLIQTLQLREPYKYSIAPSEVDLSDEDMVADPFEVVLDEVLAYSYNIKSAEYSRLAAQNQLKQMKSAVYPSLSLGSNIGTRYSDQLRGDLASQVKGNHYKQVYLSLNIPIFNNFSAKNRVAQAKVNYLNSELNYQQAVLNVTNALQSDYLDYVTALTSYHSAVENLDAQHQTFDFVKKRFETGNTDFYTYLQTLNTKNKAETDLINAKYSVVFRKKIMELYRGQGPVQ